MEGLHYLCFFWAAIVLASESSLAINSQVQGCSLVGIDLQQCLVPSTKTPFSLDSCCASLNQAVKAGYYCLCSLLRPSIYPVFSTELSVFFSNCYISVPPLTHCQVLEPHPVVIAPPLAAVPQLNQPPAAPAVPVLMPPDLPRDDMFVPLPPKVNEIPLNSKGDNSSMVDKNQTFSISPQPKLGIPERWDHFSSDGANAKILLRFSINILIVALVSNSIA